MLLFVILLSCVLQPLHYYSAFGRREALKRFVIEDGAKPAIFGSYSYDPVMQVFFPPPPDQNSKNDNGNHDAHGSHDDHDSPVTVISQDRKKVVAGSTKHNSLRYLQLRTNLPPNVSNGSKFPKYPGSLNLWSNKITNRSVTPSSQRPKLIFKKNLTSKSVKSNKV